MSEPDRAQVILLVDDDACFRRSMAIALRLEGFDVLEAGTATEALALLAMRPVSVALVDVLLGSERGEALIDQIAQASPRTKLVSVSGRPGFRSPLVERGLASHLEKPFLASDLIALLKAQP